VVSSTPRPYFTPGKDPVTILQEAGWVHGGGEWSVLRPGRFFPEKESRHALNKVLGEPQRWYGRFGKEKSLFSLTGFEPRIVYPVAYASRLNTNRNGPCPLFSHA
jgi:hypothetical protein